MVIFLFYCFCDDGVIASWRTKAHTQHASDKMGFSDSITTHLAEIQILLERVAGCRRFPRKHTLTADSRVPHFFFKLFVSDRCAAPTKQKAEHISTGCVRVLRWCSLGVFGVSDG